MNRSAGRALLSLVSAAALVGLLASCATDSTTADSGETASAEASAGAATTEQTAALVVSDAWSKAAESGMSAAFGILENHTDADVVVTGVASDVSEMQLHETVMTDGAMSMHEVDSFTVPANGTFVLEPGGNHLMFMDLTSPLEPGDDVEITLTLEDGSTLEFNAPAREFAGADEEYAGDEMSGMDGMDATERATEAATER